MGALRLFARNLGLALELTEIALTGLKAMAVGLRGSLGSVVVSLRHKGLVVLQRDFLKQGNKDLGGMVAQYQGDLGLREVVDKEEDWWFR